MAIFFLFPSKKFLLISFANRRKKLGLVWRNRKKISQIINDYLCLPFFLLIILWWKHMLCESPDFWFYKRAIQHSTEQVKLFYSFLGLKLKNLRQTGQKLWTQGFVRVHQIRRQVLNTEVFWRKKYGEDIQKSYRHRIIIVKWFTGSFIPFKNSFIGFFNI